MNKLQKITEKKDKKVFWSWIHLIAVIGLFIRLIVVFASEHINHPDEIFQYLEQAHRLEFGYGIVPWEYRHGIRSWILPGLLAGLMHIFHSLNIDDPNIYIPIIKILSCILSISVIYSSYIITRNIASENAARLASIFACFWYELVYFATKFTPEILSSYCLVLATVYVVIKPVKKSVILFGILCGISTILRFQYLPVIFVLAIVVFFKWKKPEFLIAGISCLFVVAIAGYVDYLTWGDFFASYYNNYIYNAVYKVSELFGKNSPTYFLSSLTYTSGGLFILVGILSFLPTKIPKTWLPLLLILSIIIPHSLIAHKEHRFIFGAIPFFIILTAIIISDFSSWVKHWNDKASKVLSYSLIALVLCLSLNGLAAKLPYQKQIYESSLIAKQPILLANLFLHKQSDLSAVFNNYSMWRKNGGYYYLHRNVPVYYPHQLEEISANDYSLYVSHIICSKNYQSIPNFMPIFEYGNLQIRKVINPPQKYITLDVDTQNIFKPGIDDRYEPRKKPKIRNL